MPVRVPQTNLVPQLRPAAASEPPPTREVTVRPPEANREMLIMMQQGWERGRVDDLDDPEGWPW
jgi:hypothetical protein